MGFLDRLRGHKKGEVFDKVEDPVCHMIIDHHAAAGQSTHGKNTYWFCSAACKQKFDADPHAYLDMHHH